RLEAAEANELGCIEVALGEFCHPGLSSRENRPGANPPHKDSLGPNDAGWFVRLLGDRADAEISTVNGAFHELGGDWKSFIADILRRSAQTRFTRLGVAREILQGGGPLPRFWDGDASMAMHLLG